jgi:hypothetical protein
MGLALVLEVFDREERLAVQGGQELDAGVHGLQLQAAGLGQLADDHGAGAAVAFVAAFLGACAVRVLAQPVEHGARGVDAADVDGFSAVEEPDGLGLVAALGAHALRARGRLVSAKR